MGIADEHLRHAGEDIADPHQEEQHQDRQHAVEDTCQHHAQDAQQGAFDGKIGVGLLQPVLLHDGGQQRTGRRVEDAAYGAAQDADGKKDDDAGAVRGEKEEKQRGQQDQPAFDIIAEEHDPGFVVPVPQHAADGGEDQQHAAAEGQVDALEEGVVAADLQDVEADGETV